VSLESPVLVVVLAVVAAAAAAAAVHALFVGLGSQRFHASDARAGDLSHVLSS